jgi:hypothetical protein
LYSLLDMLLEHILTEEANIRRWCGDRSHLQDMLKLVCIIACFHHWRLIPMIVLHRPGSQDLLSLLKWLEERRLLRCETVWAYHKRTFRRTCHLRQLLTVCLQLSNIFPRWALFLLPWRWRWHVPPKCQFMINPHGVIFQKTPFVMVTAMKTSKPAWNNLKVGCLHPVACTRSGSGFPSNGNRNM